MHPEIPVDGLAERAKPACLSEMSDPVRLTCEKGHRTVAITPRARIILCLIPAMLLPAIAAVFYYVLFPGQWSGRIIYGTTKLFTLVWPIAAVWAIERQPLRLKPINAAKHLAAIPMGLASGLLIAATMLALYKWSVIGDYVGLYRDAIRDKVEAFGLRDPATYLLFGTAMSVAHSLLEEYFWRWYVFGRLSKVSGLPSAYCLASFSFAAHHYIVLGCYFPLPLAAAFGTCVAIGAAFWCWLYRRQQSLVGVWLSHVLADVAIICIGYRLVFQ
ncbi:CPBP family intramembrane metalloprotease [Candidatus Sumerlaeota bacterium]|nr:CPBP family intramembrane metalloprotease [Candidatus Sumerlaeota bacterium]